MSDRCRRDHLVGSTDVGLIKHHHLLTLANYLQERKRFTVPILRWFQSRFRLKSPEWD